MTSIAYEQKLLIPVKDMMMSSRGAAVGYMMPLGSHRILGGSRYGPGLWENSIRRPDWLPIFYYKANKDGMGFDRIRNGSANVDRYHEPLVSRFDSSEAYPENLLLQFYHPPWDYRLSSGREFWDGICLHYSRGISQVEGYQKTWAKLKPYVSESIFNEISGKLNIQKNDTEW